MERAQRLRVEAAEAAAPEERAGEVQLFERKPTKEEKKAAAALKKTERDARKAAGSDAAAPADLD